tara:strand:+ start:2120 stop:2956 length:837 start_codon:yes stop_codon:yes gene_type:complete
MTLINEAIRSRLRSPTNRNNNTYVGGLIADGDLSDTFKNPLPKKFSGRVVTAAATPKISSAKVTAELKTQNAILVDKRIPHTIVPFWQFNPERKYNLTGTIYKSFKLSPNISVINFLNTSPTTDWDTQVQDKLITAKNLYLHTMFIRMVNSNSSPFSGAKVVPSEGVYVPLPIEGQLDQNTQGHNFNKRIGKTIVYKVIDASGSENNRLAFDIAAYFKDIAFFNKMFLSYDTIDTDLKVRIVLEMPVLDQWSSDFNREIYTEYNNTLHASNELVEITL